MPQQHFVADRRSSSESVLSNVECVTTHVREYFVCVLSIGVSAERQKRITEFVQYKLALQIIVGVVRRGGAVTDDDLRLDELQVAEFELV